MKTFHVKSGTSSFHIEPIQGTRAFSWRLLLVLMLSITSAGFVSAATVTGPVTCVTGIPEFSKGEVNCADIFQLDLPYNSEQFTSNEIGELSRSDTALSDIGYVEEEFFLEGVAQTYSSSTQKTGGHSGNPKGRAPGGKNKKTIPLTPDGQWNDVHKVSGSEAPYKIRLVVRRPIESNKFNGTVVLEYGHPGFGLDYGWPFMKDEIIDGGYAYIVATPLYGFDDLFAVQFFDPIRYGSLMYPGVIDYGYDIFTQAAREIRIPSAMSVDPMGGLYVERIIATGHSFSSGSLKTYINAVQLQENAIDGFLLTGNAGFAVDLNATEPVPYPTIIRTDLNADTQVLNLLAEWDLLDFDGTPSGYSARQSDSDSFRGYEYSGGAHVPRNLFARHTLNVLSDFFRNPSEVTSFYSVCQTEGNDGIHQIYVHNVALHRLNEWMKTGNAPESPQLTVVEMSPGQFDFARDTAGNAMGGIRPVSIDVPIARYDGRWGADPTPLDGDSCNQSSVKESFDQQTLDALYPNHGNYVSKVTSSAQDLKSKGFLRQYDFKKILKDASASDIGESE